MHTRRLKSLYGFFTRHKQPHKLPLLHSTINDACNDPNHKEKVELFSVSSTLEGEEV